MTRRMHLEIINTQYNLYLAAPRTLDNYQPAPSVQSGPKRHELIAAHKLCEFHQDHTCSIQTPDVFITPVSGLFDGKLLNTGVELAKNSLVGIVNDDGTPITPEEIIRKYEAELS
eukprot:112132_1